MDPMPVRFYVVLPGLGRVPGIYDDIDDARKQTDGISRAPSGFDSLDLAVRYWRSHVPDKPPPMHLRWTSAEDDGDPSGTATGTASEAAAEYRVTIEGPRGLRATATLTAAQVRSLHLIP